MICQGIGYFRCKTKLSRSHLSVGFSVWGQLKFDVSRNFSKYGARPISSFTFLLTARQYGEVVLPDASTGQNPDTLAGKLSRCKEGMAHFLPSGYKFYRALRVSRYKFNRSRETITVQDFTWGHWRSVAVQAVSEPENCHGARF